MYILYRGSMTFKERSEVEHVGKIVQTEFNTDLD